MDISQTVQSIFENEFQQGSLFKPPLGDACRYAIEGGQKLRPKILLDLAGTSSGAKDFSIFIEYLHSASLVVDDLPCMDNALERRGKPALYLKYGQSNAQLVAGKLQLASLYHLYRGIRKLPPNLVNRVENYINGQISDLYNGQYSDLDRKRLNSLPPREKADKLIKMVEFKTGSLFAITLYLAQVWRIKNISRKLDEETIDSYLDKAHKAGLSLGILYQIIDDIRDSNSDSNSNDESSINLVHNLEKWELINLFNRHVRQLKITSNGFYLSFNTIAQLIIGMIGQFKLFI